MFTGERNRLRPREWAARTCGRRRAKRGKRVALILLNGEPRDGDIAISGADRGSLIGQAVYPQPSLWTAVGALQRPFAKRET